MTALGISGIGMALSGLLKAGKEQRETMSDMILGASWFALIYIILAWVFQAIKTLVVMAIVPLGFVEQFWGTAF